jgi:D-serine dehydratase
VTTATTPTISISGTAIPVTLTDQDLDDARQRLGRFADPVARDSFARHFADVDVAELEHIHGPQTAYAMARRALAVQVVHQQLAAGGAR